MHFSCKNDRYHMLCILDYGNIKRILVIYILRDKILKLRDKILKPNIC